MYTFAGKPPQTFPRWGACDNYYAREHDPNEIQVNICAFYLKWVVRHSIYFRFAPNMNELINLNTIRMYNTVLCHTNILIDGAQKKAQERRKSSRCAFRLNVGFGIKSVQSV